MATVKAALQRFPADADTAEVAAAVGVDGGAILTDVLDGGTLERLNDDLAPWVEATPGGRDDFTGYKTCRTGALVARSPVTREIVMHPKIVDLAEAFLAPHTNRIQLHLTQVIKIQPGQGAQSLHRDRLAWGGYIPREIEPQFNTIWALTDFTEENGATRIVPGSPAWDDDRRATDSEKTQAVMRASPSNARTRTADPSTCAGSPPTPAGSWSWMPPVTRSCSGHRRPPGCRSTTRCASSRGSGRVCAPSRGRPSPARSCWARRTS